MDTNYRSFTVEIQVFLSQEHFAVSRNHNYLFGPWKFRL
jgi:hypothetical protein